MEADRSGNSNGTTLTIYVLALEGTHFYVGRCANGRVHQRYLEHLNGGGAAYTSVYAPVRILSTSPCADPLDEDREVLRLIRRHGVDRVRGGSYSQINLTAEQERSIQQQLAHANGQCFNCHGTGHFAAHCPVVVSSTNRGVAASLRRHCFQHSRSRVYNYHRHNASRFSFDDDNSSSACGESSFEESDYDDDDDSEEIRCFRCGRVGHIAPRCRAVIRRRVSYY